MRSRRTGSRSIRALPPTLPPAISTCARRYVESEYYENRAGIDGAGRHHDHGPVGQPELFLPARENVSSVSDVSSLALSQDRAASLASFLALAPA